jgi:hypothetical protein
LLLEWYRFHERRGKLAGTATASAS